MVPVVLRVVLLCLFGKFESLLKDQQSRLVEQNGKLEVELVHEGAQVAEFAQERAQQEGAHTNGVNSVFEEVSEVSGKVVNLKQSIIALMPAANGWRGGINFLVISSILTQLSSLVSGIAATMYVTHSFLVKKCRLDYIHEGNF